MNLKEQLKALLLQMRGIAAKAEEEKREFTAEEREQLTRMAKEAGDLKAKIKAAEGDDELRKAILELGAGVDLGNGQDNGGPKASRNGTGTMKAGRGRTIGEQFVSSSEFVEWMKRVAPGGRVPESARGIMSPPVEFRSLLGRKELITGADDESAGAFVQTDYTGIYEALGRIPLVLRDLISVRTTTSDLVEFVRQTAQVTQAATVPEANVTDYTGATGQYSGEKPEGTLGWEKVTAAVKTIAVWIPATKRALSDAAQLRGIIDQELRSDLDEELEDQMLNGDGVGENFTGVLNTAGILTQAWNADILTTSRQAITTLMVTGRARPTAWVINPQDWETIELLQDNDGRYYWGGPLARGQKTLWGVPVVESQTQEQGSGILADWRKAVLWDRERATIQVSDSHEDFFIRNMVAILAELRAAFGLIRPRAFIEVPFESGS